MREYLVRPSGIMGKRACDCHFISNQLLVVKHQASSTETFKLSGKLKLTQVQQKHNLIVIQVRQLRALRFHQRHLLPNVSCGLRVPGRFEEYVFLFQTGGLRPTKVCFTYAMVACVACPRTTGEKYSNSWT